MASDPLDSPSWQPCLESRQGPVYRDLVRALEADIRRGALAPGDRLPTHRELANALGVSRGTVARAYDEAQRLGLVKSGVGQGTFVAHAFEVQARRDPTFDEIDFSMAYPIYELDPDPSAVLSDLARAADSRRWLRYPTPGGQGEHREAGASWCGRFGVEAHADEVILTAGTQHALHVWMLANLRAGDTLLVGELTYPMALAAAENLGIVVEGVAMDEEGLVSESLAEVGRETSARGLYTMPTIQNPTTGVLSEGRRQEIAEIVNELDLDVFEDDIHAIFHPEPRPTPLKALCPLRVTYAASLSKSVAGGLRVAYAVPPAAERPRFFSTLLASIWSPPILPAEIASRWIADGTADAVVETKRQEATSRLDFLRERLEPRVARLRTGAYMAWVELPEGRSAAELTLAAQRRGVAVMPADTFYVGRGKPPEAIRLSLGNLTRDQIRHGIARLEELLESPGRCRGPVL